MAGVGDPALERLAFALRVRSAVHYVLTCRGSTAAAAAARADRCCVAVLLLLIAEQEGEEGAPAPLGEIAAELGVDQSTLRRDRRLIADAMRREAA